MQQKCWAQGTTDLSLHANENNLKIQTSVDC